MKEIHLNIGEGLTFNDKQLTLDFEESPYVHKRTNGLSIDSLKGNTGEGGDSVEDNYTIIKSKSGHLQTNPEVVEYIFSMCAYKVIERTRTSVDTYSVDNTQVKDINDIINELNACIDASGGTNNGAMYILKLRNLFQLRNTSSSIKLSSWPVAIDNLNRGQEDECKALFYVKEIEYSTNKTCYVKHIKLTCLWSSFDSFVKGTDYEANSKNDY